MDPMSYCIFLIKRTFINMSEHRWKREPFCSIHACKLGLPYFDFCRSCRNELYMIVNRDNELKEETLEHYLCCCTSVSKLRTKFLNRPFLQVLSDLSNTPLNAILDCITVTHHIRIQISWDLESCLPHITIITCTIHYSNKVCPLLDH